MTVNKFKQMIENRKSLKVILLIILIVLIILYLKVFFTKGVYFNDIFLKKEAASDETHYIGKDKQGDIKITVKRATHTYKKSEVIYNLQNNTNRHFIVNFKNEYNWDDGIEITDQNGNILFEGIYVIGSPYLYGNNGDILFDSNKNYGFDGTTYGNTHDVPLINVAEFATYEKESIRGDAGMMIMALILLSITAFDIKYPLFFFTLSHFIEVKDPEPTDYFIFMQKTSWIVIPLISMGLLIAAI